MFNKALLVGLTLITCSANAQGYFDFNQIPGLDNEPKVQIDLTPMMLNFVIEAARAADPTAAEVLGGIDGVRVRVYDISDDSDAVLEFIDDATSALENDDWQRMVYVDGDGQKVRIYMKFNDTNMSGLTMMVADEDGEAVFVNLAGEINPAHLGQIANNLGFGEALSGVTGGIGVGTDTTYGDADEASN